MSKNKSLTQAKRSKISKGKINEYKEAFDIFDKDKNGIISTNDIMKIMNLFSYPISRRNIQKMINDINISGVENLILKILLLLCKGKVII